MLAPDRTGYAPANGLDLYYEVYGSGDPLVLLHGGLGSIEMVAPVIPVLACERQVIAFDLQGHGRTADVDRPLRFETMADDVCTALNHLGLAPADIMGYSLGGGVALQLAIRHSPSVTRLAVISFPFRKSGWYPEVAAGMSRLGEASADAMIGSPFHQVYTRLAHRPEDWTSLHQKLHDILALDYDWTVGVSAIRTPTLLVAGDADSISPRHIAEFYGLLGGGQRDGGWDGSGVSSAQLAILPGATHYNIVTLPLLADVAATFFKPYPDRDSASLVPATAR
jgi:pimeloyl-ACP methyl ester carboxylesterase